MAGPRSDGRLAQGFYTQGDQLLTIDNLSLNGFRVACDKKSGCFHQKRSPLGLKTFRTSAEAIMLDVPAARPGGFREGSRRMTPSSSAQIAVIAFAFALPGFSVQPLKI
jgi:hypothetical protein